MQRFKDPKIRSVQRVAETGKECWAAAWVAITVVKNNSTEVDCDLHPSRTPKKEEL
jgi:hypothetical protein